MKTLALTFALLLPTSIALACGAPIPADPGSTGTAIFEDDDLVSVFVSDGAALRWERLRPSTGERTHIADIPGILQANIETHKAVDTAISALDGQIALVGKDGVHTIDAMEARTTIFGATIDAEKRWHVLAYNEGAAMLTLFSQTSAGAFTKAASLNVMCEASMLTLVIEKGGRFVGVCGNVAVTREGSGPLVDTHLPASAALRLDDQGTAIFTGVTRVEPAILRMRVLNGEATITDTITVSEAPMYALPVDDHTVIEVYQGAFAFATNDGNAWKLADQRAIYRPFLSARSAPLRVLSGDYELDLHTQAPAWQQTNLGALGVEPKYINRGGCASVDTGFAFAFVACLMLYRARRKVSSNARA